MGSSPAIPPPVSPAFLAVFQAEVGPGGVMPFARFMELALYHPAVGYYRQDRIRVGTTAGTDFLTASHRNVLFGELVCAACTTLLGDRRPAEHTFVEIGAEPGSGVLDGVEHPFRAIRTVRLGDPHQLAGACVVFSNELFDAQPCVRTVYRQGHWHEIGVRLEGGIFVETDLPFSADSPGVEGYRFDRPIAAARLADRIAAQPWHGLFVAFDYGKSLVELSDHTPGGTIRACHRHVQSNDVLARPGEQDLTCHVCWDWISDALRDRGLGEPSLEFQEAFFLRHATRLIAALSEAEAARTSRRKLALQQLLHPSQMGQKFQVLHALR